MILKGLVDEDIVNYRKTSMYLIFPNCSFKCDKECKSNVCQNSSLARASTVEISPEEVCQRYINNPLTSAIVCAGLEPFDSKFDLLAFVDCLRRRYACDDDVVIYTGYTEEELNNEENEEQNFLFTNLKNYDNIIIKFGRYVPFQDEHYDDVLGVSLASPNQYAKKVS